jgi:hypothetical protein
MAPKDVSDGKANMGRFSADPYKTTIDAVNNKYAESRGRLQQALDAVAPPVSAATTVFRPLFAINSPVDPVTGR